MRTPASNSPVWKVVNGFTDLHVQLYRLSKGKVLGGFGKAPILLLHHKGAKSGKVRVLPLLYIRDGERVVVVASKGGTDKHPAWFHNLKAHPSTIVEIKGSKHAVHAHVASPEEKAKYWPMAVAVYGEYETYQRQADEVGREIPVVILDPA